MTKSKSPKRIDVVDSDSSGGVNSSAIKLSHIPYGFFEEQIASYFSQFGRVIRVRVARSIKTGNHKGWAFVLFDSPDVASIVTETMDGYLMYEKRMQCKQLKLTAVPRCLTAGSRVVHPPRRNAPALKHARLQNRTRDAAVEYRSHRALVQRLLKNNEKLTQLGVDYQFIPPRLPTQPRRSTAKKLKKEEPLDDEIKIEPPPSDTDEDDGDTTYASKMSMIVDSSEDEIVFKTPPNAVRKMKHRRTRQLTIIDEEEAAAAALVKGSVRKSNRLMRDQLAVLEKVVSAEKSVSMKETKITRKSDKCPRGGVDKKKKKNATTMIG